MGRSFAVVSLVCMATDTTYPHKSHTALDKLNNHSRGKQHSAALFIMVEVVLNNVFCEYN